MHYLYVDEVIAKMESEAKEAESKAKESQDTVVEMVFDAIEELGEISETVRERIKKEKDIMVLKSIHKVAMKAESVEQFEEKIANL